MKKYLLSIPAALGLLALVPAKSKAQDFSFSVGVAPGYYAPGYYNGGYCDPGMGITTTDAFITAPPTIQVITMATATRGEDTKRNFKHAKRQSSSETTHVVQATIGHLR